MLKSRMFKLITPKSAGLVVLDYDNIIIEGTTETFLNDFKGENIERMIEDLESEFGRNTIEISPI